MRSSMLGLGHALLPDPMRCPPHKPALPGSQLVEEYGVTAVPHFVILRGGKKVADYVGSKEEGLEATIIAAAA